jgi:hypothetical protein
MASVNISDLKQAVDSNTAPANESGSLRTRYVLGPTSKRLVLDRRHVSTAPAESGSLAVSGSQTQDKNFYLSG